MSDFLNDTFTATDGTAISGRAASPTGGTWTACGFGSSTGTIESNSLRAHSDASVLNIYNNQAAGSQDYTVLFSAIRRTGGTKYLYVGARFDSGGHNGYIAGLNGDGVSVDIYRMASGTPSLLETLNMGDYPATGETWNFILSVSKVTTTCVIDLSVQRTNGDWVQPDGTWDTGQIVGLTHTDNSPFEPTDGGYVWTFFSRGIDLESVSASGSAPPPPPDLAGTIITPLADEDGVTLSLTVSDGTAPYSTAFYRGTTADFTPGGGNLLGTDTGATPSYQDTTGTVGVRYWYQAITTDDDAATVTALPVAAIRKLPSFKIAFCGDSNTYGAFTSSAGGATAPPAQAAKALAALCNCDVAFSNQGTNGLASGDWASGQTPLTNAKTAFDGLTGTVGVFCLAIGTNDSAGAINSSKATYKANVQSFVNDIQADYPTAYIILLTPIYTSAGANNGTYTYPASTLIDQYRAALDEIVTAEASDYVLRGDDTAYNKFADNTASWYGSETFASGDHTGEHFYLHANDLGARQWGAMIATSIYSRLFGSGGTYTITVHGEAA